MTHRPHNPLTMHARTTTLAVLSCALALLAAHPAEARVLHDAAPATVQPAEARVASQELTRLSVTPPVAEAPVSRQRTPRQVMRPAVLPRHTSLLMTALDQLSRMVTRELSPVIHADLVPGGALTRVPPTYLVTAARPARAGAWVLPLPREQAWAIARQLLAPPQAS